jgi:hypothetical protein
MNPCRTRLALFPLFLALPPAVALATETLYNGIVLSAPWPPRDQIVDEQPTATPAYLISPPAVIPIDVGRQLFVDRFLVESTDLRRTFHSADYYPDNPVIKPDRPWETAGLHRTAMAFSDGIWYDPHDRLFKAWYQGGGGKDWMAHNPATLFAQSNDGIHWDKPALDVQPGTNIVQQSERDSATVWLDLEEKDPQRRYKFLYSHGGIGPTASLHFSSDGIHWGPEVLRTANTGDRITMFWNPFRRVWVASLRIHSPIESEMGRQIEIVGKARAPYKIPGERVRYRGYHEGPDIFRALTWKVPPQAGINTMPMAYGEVVPWVGADRLDPNRIDLGVRPELYCVDAVAYESLMVGLFTIWRGQPDREQGGREKPNEVAVGFSRDGFHWYRPFRRALLPVSEDPHAWNHGNVQSVGGCCLVVGDRLFFYMSGRSGGANAPGENATGLATLRRDGFVSMDAPNRAGSLVTRPVRFQGRHLFVNVDSSQGELGVEILDQANRVIAPYSLANCEAVSVDNTLQEVSWRGAPDLAPLAGKPVKFRFHLRDGSLYSFWVSSDPSGASHGYVAAGGPGFTGALDTVGSAIYRHGFKQKTLD